MLDQKQVATAVPVLSALLEHPEFRQGLVNAQKEFLGSYDPAPLTQEEMIEEVELNLSRRITQRSQHLCLVYRDKPSSYLFNLGFVVGLINEGLSYIE